MDAITAGPFKKSRYVTIIVILAIAVSVSLLFLFLLNISAKPPVVSPESDWVVVSYRDSTGIVLPVIDGTEITARFGNDSIISGNSGCNAYTAAYLRYGKQIAITPPAHAQFSCPSPGIMQQESAYLADLSRAAFLQSGPNGMKILNNESKVILTFRQV